jgi:hypothetical protein
LSGMVVGDRAETARQGTARGVNNLNQLKGPGR